MVVNGDGGGDGTYSVICIVSYFDVMFEYRK